MFFYKKSDLLGRTNTMSKLDEFIDFRAFEPATVQTFAQCWRNKVWHYLIRAMQDRNEPARAAFWLGHASAAVSVMYDVNHPAAYRAKERYDLVFRICKDTAVQKLNAVQWELQQAAMIY